MKINPFWLQGKRYQKDERKIKASSSSHLKILNQNKTKNVPFCTYKDYDYVITSHISCHSVSLFFYRTNDQIKCNTSY